MKKCILAVLLIQVFCCLSAQDIRLEFGDDGEFRIAQFTDMHLVLGASRYCDIQAGVLSNHGFWKMTDASSIR